MAEKIVKYEDEYGAQNVHAPSYLCSTADFVRETSATDGSGLEVVDESADKVVRYCVAFKGRWRDR